MVVSLDKHTNGMETTVVDHRYFNEHSHKPYIPVVGVVGGGKIGSALARALIGAETAGEVMIWNRTPHEESPATQGVLRALDQSSNIYTAYSNAVRESKGITNSRKSPPPFPVTCGYDNLTNFLDKPEVVFITAGAARKEDPVTHEIPTREQLAAKNIKMIEEMAQHAGESYKRHPDKKQLYVIVTNPVDKCVDKFIDVSGIPSDQVIGLGNILDQSRLNQAIHDTLNIEPERVRGQQVLGNHGNKMVVPLSLVEIQKQDGNWVKLEEYAQEFARNNPAKVQEYQNYVTENKYFEAEREAFKDKTGQDYPGTGTDWKRTDAEIILDKIRFETIQGGAIMTKLLKISDHEAPADMAHVVAQEYARVNCEQVESIPLNCSFHSEKTEVTHGVPVHIQPDGKVTQGQLPELNSEERAQLTVSAKACKSKINMGQAQEMVA